MHLYQINIQQFKNYESEQISFPARITCLVGNNGAGKTNILDAIHYLSFCKSYFNVIDSCNIAHKADQFSITGKFRRIDIESSTDQAHCLVRRNQRKIFKYNGKDLERLADHIGRIPAVMVSPYDTTLIDAGSEERRRYIDMVISQYDRIYLDDLISYNRALTQRNSLLKQMAVGNYFDPLLLEPWDAQLAKYGAGIFEKRESFIQQFVPVFANFYQHLSDDAEMAGIEYLSQLRNGISMHDLLRTSAEKDRALRYTSAGVHKDDLTFTLAGVAAKRYGSQGQQKTFILALKLAQYHFLRDLLHIRPILLLDDIFDKLDRNRIEKLMEMVNTPDFGQIFISDTNEARIDMIFKSIGADMAILYVSNGSVVAAPIEEEK